MKKSDRKRNENHSKKNDLIRICYIIIIFLSIGILIGVVSYTSYKLNNITYNPKIISIRTINTSVNIVQYGAGLNGDSDALKFGKVPLDGSATRYLNITTSNNALIKIEISGNITRFLSVNENNFILAENTSEMVSFQLEAPNNTTTGNYSGTIKIIFLKP